MIMDNQEVNVLTNVSTRLRIRTIMVVLVCALIVLPVGATPATANPGDYQFDNLNSELCLDVVDWGAYNGANVQQWGCWNGSPQLWYFENGVRAAGKDGYYDTWFLVRTRTTGRCLDVSGISQENGANVHVWDCWGGPNQRWAIGYPGYGTITLRALHSNKCLEVYGLNKGYGGNVVQWDCWLPRPGPNQQWYPRQFG